MSAPPFAKHLASNDKKTRDKAIKSLASFLADDAQEPISKSDMDKLWKGIFYCFWMSDKPLVQQALASELAQLLLTMTSISSSLSFLRGFWEATVREWNGIDRLRLDKYYMLVRRFVNATFTVLGRSKWDKSACDTYNDILTGEGGPLSPADIRIPTSLAYHLSDIYVEELDKALAAAPEPFLPAPLATLLTPFFTLAARTPTSITYKRVQSEVFTPLFSALSSSQPLEDQPPAQKRMRLDPDAQQPYATLVSNACFDSPEEGKIEGGTLRKKLLRRIFEIASEPETRDSSRRKMYALFKESTEDDGSDEG
ncbi:nucleolar protein,Nop52-domain-containing protein [Mycena olivaceomarginata]|nr:nucleolar protein,Nop52-domain-containing protein [Mycena olivaceomarginata]